MNDSIEQNPNRPQAALVEQICADIKKRKKKWESAFDEMRRCQRFVRHGAEPGWKFERVNVVQRHVRDRVASLYAKEPTTTFKRRKRLEFSVWDGSQATLAQAQMTVQTATQATMQGGPFAMNDSMVQGLEEAQEILTDFAQGMSRRAMVERIGETATLAYDYYQDQELLGSRKPNRGMIRRGIVAGVGYKKLGFERVTKPKPEVTTALNQHTERLDEIERRGNEVEEGEVKTDSAEAEELRQMIRQLEAEPQIVVTEGLISSFPASTAIIPDELMTNLVDFEGCEQVAEEFVMTKAAAEAKWGIPITSYTPYTKDGEKKDASEMVVIWQNWNIRTGLVHTVCDGFDQFLTEDFTPPVKVKRFWPWFAFIPNPSDDPDSPWPISEVALIWDAQVEINRSFAGNSEARHAARPGTVGRKGLLSDEDRRRLQKRQAFEHIELNIGDDVDPNRVMSPFPTPSYNPGLYEPGMALGAIEMATGASEARVNATPRVSATASSISETAYQDQANSVRDELDDLNSAYARAAGEVMLQEISEEEMKRIVGQGAMWSPMRLKEVQEEIWLDVEFGSSGRKNRQQIAATLRDLTPLLLQLPNLSIERLVKAIGEVLSLGIEPLDLFEDQGMSVQAMNQAIAPAGSPPPSPQGAASTEPTIV